MQDYELYKEKIDIHINSKGWFSVVMESESESELYSEMQERLWPSEKLKSES